MTDSPFQPHVDTKIEAPNAESIAATRPARARKPWIGERAARKRRRREHLIHHAVRTPRHNRIGWRSRPRGDRPHRALLIHHSKHTRTTSWVLGGGTPNR